MNINEFKQWACNYGVTIITCLIAALGGYFIGYNYIEPDPDPKNTVSINFNQTSAGNFNTEIIKKP